MRQIIEYLPIIIFGAVYFYTRDIFFSTLVLIIGLFLQLVMEYSIDKKFSKKTFIVFLLTLLFGGSAILFQNEDFLFWRPTIINWIFCLILIFFEFIFNKNLIKVFSKKYIMLPDRAWKTLLIGWSFGFFILGLINIIIAYNFNIDIWVSYKLFGSFLVTLFYFFVTMIYLWKSGYLDRSNH